MDIWIDTNSKYSMKPAKPLKASKAFSLDWNCFSIIEALSQPEETDFSRFGRPLRSCFLVIGMNY